jgi:predicted dehydrogenase
MKALVVGYGSIGSRHTRILEELGCSVAVVSSRDVPVELRFASIGEAVGEFGPDYVVIATGTSRHVEGIAALADAGFHGTLLVEKPLFDTVGKLPQGCSQDGFVAYNLRFHPLMQRLRDHLMQETIISVQAYVGQYLPQWRPGRDYRTVYSADKQAGGGVLRDLSHELDLLNWLLGGWQKLTALGGRFSKLEITSDDVFAVMMTAQRCPVASLQMNYLDRVGRRRMLVNTVEKTFEVDFSAGRLMIDGQCEEHIVDRDYTYREMHRALLEGRCQDVCTFAEGIDVVCMIAAAERAVEEGQWITK